MKLKHREISERAVKLNIPRSMTRSLRSLVESVIIAGLTTACSQQLNVRPNVAPESALTKISEAQNVPQAPTQPTISTDPIAEMQTYFASRGHPLPRGTTIQRFPPSEHACLVREARRLTTTPPRRNNPRVPYMAILPNMTQLTTFCREEQNGCLVPNTDYFVVTRNTPHLRNHLFAHQFGRRWRILRTMPTPMREGALSLLAYQLEERCFTGEQHMMSYPPESRLMLIFDRFGTGTGANHLLRMLPSARRLGGIAVPEVTNLNHVARQYRGHPEDRCGPVVSVIRRLNERMLWNWRLRVVVQTLVSSPVWDATGNRCIDGGSNALPNRFRPIGPDRDCQNLVDMGHDVPPDRCECRERGQTIECIAQTSGGAATSRPTRRNR